MNAEDTTNTEAGQAEAPEKAPTRRRSSRRVTAAAAAPSEETQAAAAAESAPAAQAPASEGAEETDATEAAPKKRATRSRKKAAAPAEEAVAVAPASDEANAKVDEPTDGASAEDSAPAPKRATRSRKKAAPKTEAEDPAASGGDSNKADTSQATDTSSDEATSEKPKGRSRSNRKSRNENSDATGGAGDAAEQSEKTEKNEGSASDNHDNKQGGKNGGKNDSQRSSRTRQRDRKRRGADDLEPELTEDDVLLPIAGLLDVLDNYAFVRTTGYLPGVSDVYVSLGQVKKYGLRRGDAIVGAIRQPREGDSGGRQKYNALVKLDTVNGRTIEENEKRTDLDDLVQIYPTDRIVFDQQPNQNLGAAIDKAAPMGLGQRALITLPADVPAAPLLAELASGVSAAHPEAHLMLVLTNAQPEAVTELQRAVRGEVVAATFDRPAEDQITVVELAIERASRLTELGHDVVLLIDSLSDAALALSQAVQGGRSQNDPGAIAIAQIKRLIAAARNAENGGSLTLIAAARRKSHVELDKQLRRELTPVVNSLVKITGTRTSPAVDAEASFTIGAL